MEDDPKGVTPPGPNPAHTVAKIDAIDAACARHGTMMHGKDDRVTALERDDLRS